MTNPFIKNYQSKLLYTSAWITIAVIHALVLLFAVDLPFNIAIADSVVFNALFSLFSIPLWYMVKYNKPTNNPIVSFVIPAIILLSVWLFAGYWIFKLFFPQSSEYQNYLWTSLIWRALEGVLLYTLVMLFYYVILYAEKLQEQARNEIFLNKTLKDSELNALKSQINPHFLFNSLNSINSLMLVSPEKAQEMLISLSEYLRYTALSTHEQFTSLQNEIENTEHYLAIEKVRFGDKLNYTFNYAAECLPFQVPAMILQPLFENAIKYGVYESIANSQIIADIEQKESCLHIRICNNFDLEEKIDGKKSGIGLKNIQSRLQLLYQNQAFLQSKVEGNTFCVTLQIPLIFPKDKI